MIQRMKKHKKWLPAALYAAWLLVWAAAGLAGFVQNRTATPLALDAATAQAEGLAGQEGIYESQDGDPKLIFQGIARPTRAVRLAAEFSADPGEMDLFYTQKEGQGFSVKKRVVGTPQADGSFLYTLPMGTRLQNLRLDLGTTAGNRITLGEITLDPPLPAGHFWPLTLRQVAEFAAVPALALCMIYTIIEEYPRAKKYRRTKQHS